MSNISKIDGKLLKVVNDEITLNVPTDEQLETLSDEKLEEYGINAKQLMLQTKNKIMKSGDTMTGALNFEISTGFSPIITYSEDKSKSISYSPVVRDADSSLPSSIRFLEDDSNVILRINRDTGALSSDKGGWSEERVPMGQTYEAGSFGSNGTYTGNSVAIGGVIRHVSASNSKIAVLPSYGSWLINMFSKNSTGQMTGNVTGTGIGQVVAGGTTIGSSSSSTTITGYVQRVA